MVTMVTIKATTVTTLSYIYDNKKYNILNIKSKILY